MPKKSKPLTTEEIIAKKILGSVGRKYAAVASIEDEHLKNEKDVLISIEIHANDIKIWAGELNLTIEEIKIANIAEALKTKISILGEDKKPIIKVCNLTGHTEMFGDLQRDSNGFIRRAKDVKKIKNPILEKYIEVKLPAKLAQILDPKKNPQKDSPLDIFWTYIINMKKLPIRPENTKLNISAIYMHRNEYAILKKELKAWAMLTYEKSNDEKINQAITWALVDCAPNIIDEPFEKHCQPNCIYVKKSENLWMENDKIPAAAPLRSKIVDDRIPKTADGHIIH